MGKKLDALLGRGFKPSKFKSVISVAISRLSVFKNQRLARYNLARSDVFQLLQLGHHDRALLRVEQVMKEQNMLDVFGILEGYCNLLVERVHLIEQERDCPDEVKEAVSGLIFASSRCGDFPELQEIRAIFVSRYGKEFAARAIELRNNCGVNTTIIQKLSTKQPDLQSRRNVLNEIAAENGIALQVHETSVSATNENLDGGKNQLEPSGKATNLAGAGLGDEGFSDSQNTRKKYKDVADAAQAAFESAAHAAAAARAAMELSRSDFPDPDDNGGKRHEPSSKGEGSQAEDLNHSSKTSSPSSSTESLEANLDMMRTMSMSLDEVDPIKLLEKDVVIYESDDDSYGSRELKDKDEEHSDNTSSDKQVPSSLRAGLKQETGPENPSGTKGKRPFTINKGPFSARTRQVRGY